MHPPLIADAQWRPDRLAATACSARRRSAIRKRDIKPNNVSEQWSHILRREKRASQAIAAKWQQTPLRAGDERYNSKTPFVMVQVARIAPILDSPMQLAQRVLAIRVENASLWRAWIVEDQHFVVHLGQFVIVTAHRHSVIPLFAVHVGKDICKPING